MRKKLKNSISACSICVFMLLCQIDYTIYSAQSQFEIQFENTEGRDEISRGNTMAVSYKKLWKLLIDKNMIKKDLRLAAGLSTNVIAKLGKNENVSTEVLGKICKALDCDITDIIEFIDEDEPCT